VYSLGPYNPSRVIHVHYSTRMSIVLANYVVSSGRPFYMSYFQPSRTHNLQTDAITGRSIAPDSDIGRHWATSVFDLNFAEPIR